MRIGILKADNLVKLLDGLSKLDNKSQEQITSIVNALYFASKKAGKTASTDTLFPNEINLNHLRDTCVLPIEME
jgi:hypothetical protein